jgi:hypothetical protein
MEEGFNKTPLRQSMATKRCEMPMKSTMPEDLVELWPVGR